LLIYITSLVEAIRIYQGFLENYTVDFYNENTRNDLSSPQSCIDYLFYTVRRLPTKILYMIILIFGAEKKKLTLTNCLNIFKILVNLLVRLVWTRITGISPLIIQLFNKLLWDLKSHENLPLESFFIKLVEIFFKRGPEKFIIYQFNGEWRLNGLLYNLAYRLKNSGCESPDLLIKALANKPLGSVNMVDFIKMRGPSNKDHFVNYEVTHNNSAIYVTAYEKALNAEPIPFFDRNIIIEKFVGVKKISTGLYAENNEFIKISKSSGLKSFSVEEDKLVMAMLATKEGDKSLLSPKFEENCFNLKTKLVEEASLLGIYTQIDDIELATIKVDLDTRAFLANKSPEIYLKELWYNL